MKMNKFWRFLIKIVSLFIPDGPNGDRARGALYQPFLKSAGSNFKVAANAFIFNPNGLTVGNNVYIGFGTYLGQGNIKLDDEVLIGNGASITASNHLPKNGSFRFGGFEAKDINVGKGVWIAANSCILAGVNLGHGSLIAAGSVVTKDVPENTIAGGVPARVIKENIHE